MNNITLILQGKDAKMWTIMKALEKLGAFDVTFGKVSIDFDGQGNISNVKIEKNSGAIKLLTPIDLQ